MRVAVFDLDGTLLDTAPDIHVCAVAALAAEGLGPITLDQTRACIGAGSAMFVTRALTMLGADPDGPLHARVLAGFLAGYDDATALTRPYPGAIEALDALRDAGWRLGICTNKPERPARLLLEHLGLMDRFGALLGGDSLAVRKPDPAPLRAVLAGLGAAHGLYVGDSEVDAATAQAAGVPFALFTGGYRKAPVAALPHDWAFDDHTALPGWMAAQAAALAVQPSR